ncbi:MAG: ATP-grasp domain-containing protein [Muribaculaceae bacterium]|nr:ATP-grasp domain-containing protein [Muribaculaceae bacterium]
MRHCDVIVTYCWNRVGYNILRCLTNHGLSVIVGDTSDRNICSMSKFATANFTYPDPFTEEENFISCLIERIYEYKPKVLIPTHDESLVIAKHRNRFPKELIIPIADYKLLQSLSDKYQATLMAYKAEVPTPKLYSDLKNCTYPLIIKTKIGNSAKGVYIAKTESQAQIILDKYNPEEILIEEFIPGYDICVDCIRYPGFFHATVYKALLTKTNGGGTTTQRVIVDIPLLTEFAKQLLDSVDYHGVCGIDFRYNEKTNEYAFIEVNARYTGGLATPIAAGFDIPYIHYCLATQGKYDTEINIKYGTKTKWILGDIITLVSSIVSLSLTWQKLRQILSFKGYDAFDDFRQDDKKAIIGEMSYYINKLLKNKKLNP